MINMRTIATALIPLMMSTNALADDAFSMVGTWKGLSNTTVMGPAMHHEMGQNVDQIKFVRTVFTLVVDVQEGQNFAGHLASAHDNKEVVLGALTADRESGVMIDNDGILRFKVQAANQLESCYAHAPESSNQHSGVAACIVFTRQ
jgi:hypothetical protein